jgi:ketosteroid isomerase-like protein
MEQAEKVALIQHYLDAYQAFHLDGMLDCLHEQVHFQYIANGSVQVSTEGTDAFRQLAEGSAGLFSARQQTITDLREEGDIMHADLAFRGTLAQATPDGLQAGTEIQLLGRSAFRFQDGCILSVSEIIG